MVFRRRMLAPINSIKHYVGQPNFTVAVGGSTSLELADVVVAPVSPEREKVSEGSIIKAIYLEYWIITDGATNTTSQFVMTVEKSPSGVVDPAFADMLNLGGYANKKNILYTTQGLVTNNTAGANPMPIIREWLKIPKGKQRMGHKDRLLISFATVEQVLRICGFVTYKEYV